MDGTDEPGPCNGNTNTSRHADQRSPALSECQAKARPRLGRLRPTIVRVIDDTSVDFDREVWLTRSHAHRGREPGPHVADGGGARAQPDSGRRSGHARGPRAAHGTGPLDRRAARRGAARAPARLRGGRQRLDRRAPADRARLQPRRGRRAGRRPRRHPLAAGRVATSRARRWPSARTTPTSRATRRSVLGWVHERFEELLDEVGRDARRRARDRHRRARRRSRSRAASRSRRR